MAQIFQVTKYGLIEYIMTYKITLVNQDFIKKKHNYICWVH